MNNCFPFTDLGGDGTDKSVPYVGNAFMHSYKFVPPPEEERILRLRANALNQGMIAPGNHEYF